MKFDKNKPYNNLPLLPPKCDIESKEILKKANSANMALVELRCKGDAIPNQNILLDALTLIEAKDSSEIENIFTTHDALYQASLLGENHADHATKEVSRYRQALWHGVDLLKQRPLSTNLFIELVQIITQNTSGIRNSSGTKIANSKGDTIYTPPEGEDLIRKKIANLENFIHDEDDNIDPLIKLAIIHYQFEAIHPFSDGNGRVGRIINILYLLQQNRLKTPVLFLSRYFIQNNKGYYGGLKNVTEKEDWQSWILYILDAIEHTARTTIEKIDEIIKLMEKFINLIKINHPKIYSKDLVEVLFAQPYCRVSSLTKDKIVARKAASTYLKKIEALSLLSGKKVGKEMVYVNDSLLEILRK
jgi:Fic family protein